MSNNWSRLIAGVLGLCVLSSIVAGCSQKPEVPKGTTYYEGPVEGKGVMGNKNKSGAGAPGGGAK